MDATTFSKTFRVTQAAIAAIAAGAKHRNLDREIVTIARGLSFGRPVWGVGFMSQGDLPESEISDMAGARFYVDPQWRIELASRQLDVSEGGFVLRPRTVD